ncbi:hypothetical protein [Pseudomonas abietaniphila]|uniref:hypothetical protein n=1 Tax=Pseudomonas abietaniphila TaxID=89065 RepID=UPI00078420B9|nr:hypothetical protein [Pseudomonas abietaniphila]
MALFLMVLATMLICAIGMTVTLLLNSSRPGSGLAWLGAIGTFFVLILQWIWFATDYNGPERTKARDQQYQAESAALRRELDESECRNTVAAFVMSQGFVKRSLKSPASAVFPSQAVASTQAGQCKFVVVAYVDSQNGFGALIRTSYVASVEYLPATREWKLNSLNM